MRHRIATGLQLLVGLAYGSAALAQTPALGFAAEPAIEEPDAEVVIIASTPVRGAELPENQVAGSVQRVNGAQIHATRGATLADVLQLNLAGISLNDTQGSPFMPDLNYRGFTASPLLGLPQGLAVYQNGMRLNEPFGDTLAWDLVPEFAVQEATLVTGLNPTYGLNALGGALSLRMKDGFSFHGARGSLSGGSFGRVRGTLEAGLERAEWAVYAGADVLREDGWRDHSPCDVRRLYLDVRRRDEHSELALNASFANSSLAGNGPAPLDLLAQRRRAVFTYPDETKTALALLGAQGSWSISKAVYLNATAFFRASVRQTLNGDAAELTPCDGDPGVLCEQDDPDPVRSTSGGPIPARAGGEAALNATRAQSTSGGGALQLVARAPLFEHRNQLTLGVAADAARNRFQQESEVGSFRADRGVDVSDFFRGGEEGEVRLRASSRELGVYGADTLALLPHMFLTLSGRMNWFGVRLRDPTEVALNADHGFFRFNPAAGLSFVPAPGLVFHVDYNEANRAPTAAELSCADPEAPCRLPNAFLSDPPLRQVVTRSVELGARFRRELGVETQLSAAFAVFAARNLDDILFVAGSLVGTGYFRNAGATERAGFEASFSARFGRVEPYLNYQFLRATFETSLLLPGVNHPDASYTVDGAVISVRPGDRIPGLPMHTARVGADVKPAAGLSMGAWLNLASSQYYRGDEANLLHPLAGYATLNARASYELSSIALVFVRADNLLSAKYETFGLLGHADEVIPGADNPRYAAPGPPLAVWAGIDVQLSR